MYLVRSADQSAPPQSDPAAAARADATATTALLAVPLDALDQALAQLRADLPPLPQLHSEQRRRLTGALPHDPVPVAQAQVQALAAAPLPPVDLPAPLTEQLATHDALVALEKDAREVGEAALCSAALLDEESLRLEQRLIELLRTQLCSDRPDAEKQRWLEKLAPLLRLRPEASPRYHSPLLARLSYEAEGGRATALLVTLSDRLRAGEAITDEELHRIASALRAQPPQQDSDGADEDDAQG